MQLITNCDTCGVAIEGCSRKCSNCSEGNASEGPSRAVLDIIKHPFFKYPLIGIVVIILLGIAVQAFFPDCRCSFQSCSGCGGEIGNTLGKYSNGLFALAAIGLVLLTWFGIPALILGLILTGIYKLFSKKNNDE